MTEQARTGLGTSPVSTGAVPPFTALVAAWNEAHHIREHIESFIALRFDHCQLVLCAGGPDGTYDVARVFEADNIVVVEQQPEQGKQRALRECLRHARCDLLYLTDADCLFDRETVRTIFAPIVSGHYHVSTGGCKPLARQTASPFVQYQACRDLFAYDHAPPEADGLLGRNSAITRACLVGAGAFTETVDTGTDYHLGKKVRLAGLPIALAKESRVQTAYPHALHASLSAWRRWIKNLAIHDAAKHRMHLGRAVTLALLVLSPPLTLTLLPRRASIPSVLAFLLALRARYRDLRYAAWRGY